MEKKAAYYRRLGCSPTPARVCNGQPCFFDHSCLASPPRDGGLGCSAAGISGACRFCGFGVYEACPTWYDCSGPCHAWAPAHSAWCFKNYDVHCPRFLHHVEFWQNETSSALSAVGEQFAGALDSAKAPYLAAAAFFSLLAFLALAWRSVLSQRSSRSGDRRQMVLLGEEEEEADCHE